MLMGSLGEVDAYNQVGRIQFPHPFQDGVSPRFGKPV
jgi:hypothetical protein